MATEQESTGHRLDYRLSRRQMMRLMVVGSGAVALGSLLSACGGDEDDDSPEEPGTEAAATTATPPSTGTQPADATPEATTAGADETPETEPTAPGGSPAEGKTLIIRNRGEIVSMDAHQSAGDPDDLTYENIYSRLVFPLIGPDGEELVNDLATSWEVSDDGLEYTFSLREGVAWHRDYGTLTAEDVVWTLNRVKDPATASRFAPDYARVADIVATDELTVVITLAEADPTFPSWALGRTGWIMNQRALEEKGDNYSSEPVGTGPYIFVDWVRGEECTLVRNEGHWLLDKGNVVTAIFKFLNDDTIVELALRSGDIDIGYVEAPEIQRAVVDNQDLVVLEKQAPRVHHLGFGTFVEGHPLANVDFRRALSLGIDRQLIAEEAMEGMGSPANTMLNPSMHGYVDTEFFPFVYDPEEAQQLLEASGYDGEEIEIITQSSGLAVDIATIVQAFWSEIGVNATVSALERALFFERTNAGDYDVAATALARNYPEQAIYPYFSSAGIPTPNATGYTGIDDLAEALRPEPDFDRRAEILAEMQAKIAEDVVRVPLVYPALVLAMQPNVSVSFTPSIWYYPIWLINVAD